MLWPEGTKRITSDLIKKYLVSNKLLVAVVENPDSTQQVVGCLKVERDQKAKKPSLNVSLLAVKSEWFGHKIGWNLMAKASQFAEEQNYQFLSGEVLFPYEDALKESRNRLLNWYLSMGFIVKGRIPFEQLYPEKAKGLATPCYLQGIQKKI